jgi:hypothetical protein
MYFLISIMGAPRTAACEYGRSRHKYNAVKHGLSRLPESTLASMASIRDNFGVCYFDGVILSL